MAVREPEHTRITERIRYSKTRHDICLGLGTDLTIFHVGALEGVS